MICHATVYTPRGKPGFSRSTSVDGSPGESVSGPSSIRWRSVLNTCTWLSLTSGRSLKDREICPGDLSKLLSLAGVASTRLA